MPTARKSVRRALKNTGKALKNTGRALKNAGKALKNTGKLSDSVETAGLSPPTLPQIPLAAPERTGRAVENQELVLKNAEVRLLLAWKYRNMLDAALPQDPPFHAHAWSALRVLKGEANRASTVSNDADPGREKTQSLLEDLQRRLSALRGVVEDTTRPGHLARVDLKFGTTLRTTRDLLDVAPEILTAARKWQHRFPALTDTALEATQQSLEAARKAVRGRRRAEITGATHRADRADSHQLALDVLLDELDHLRSAARTTLADTRPLLAAHLIAPLEPGHPSRNANDEAPAAGEPTAPTN